MCRSGTAFGPSESAWAGSGCVSMKMPGDAHGDRGARQHRHELALAARRCALTTRQLHRVRRVEHHRCLGLAHDREASHVGDQVVVAEAHATLASEEAVFRQAFVACRGARLVDDVDHVVRREELALLDVHRLAALRHGTDEIGLPAQEGRCLQQVDRACRGFDLVLAVHVGHQRHAERALDLGQDLQPQVDARAAERCAARAVGLVVARLEDERHAERRGDFLELAGDIHLQLFRLDDAGAGDEEERLVETDLEAAELQAATFCVRAA